MKLPINDKKFLFLLFAVLSVITLEIFSVLGINIPMPYAPIFFATFILIIGYKVIWSGMRAATKLNFSNINLLMLIAVIGAFYLKEFPEAAVLIVLYVLGERLEEIGFKNAKSALEALVSKSPKTAFVKEQNNFIPIEQVSVGSIIQVKPGEMIPLDGLIVEGETSVDEAAITGEPIPKDKQKGDPLFAGTLNKNGFIEIKTTKLAADTTFSKIIRLTFEATVNKSETQKFIQQFSKYYTPAMILLALFLFVVPVFIFQQDSDQWLKQAITLLVIACPCALVISTPVAFYAAIGNASAKGALIKGGKYLEVLANIKVIAVDKTRTLTFGNPIVSDVFTLNGISREKLLACTAGAEIFSEHPLAQAIVNASNKEGFEPHKAQYFKTIMGKGATAKCLVCKDEKILLGKLEFINEYQDRDLEAQKIVEQLSSLGKTSVVISFGKGIAGIIGLMDEIKPDSIEALKQLKALNIEPVMLTGDTEQVAHHVAQQVGIKNIFSGQLPENKAEKIKDLLQQYQSVAMVGDGINDAPALAYSTVGIAMAAAGSDTAIETADIALMNDKLLLIPFLIRLGKKTLAQIKFNTFGAIIIKLIFIALAFLGYSNLVFAIAADVGVTVIVILLSLRLLKFESGNHLLE